MAKCPNCGLPTMRTKDWACQWCGYPLVSGIYGKTSKTLAELKDERLGEAAGTTLLIESGQSVGTEPEPNQVSEVEVSAETEPEPVQAVKSDTPEPGPVPEEKPEPEAVMEEEPEFEAVTEERPEPEAVMEERPEPEAIPEVTASELCASYQEYGMAGHDEFKDRVFQVKGIVNSIVIKDVVGQYRVALTDHEPHPLGDIYCKFEQKDVPELNRLTVGQETIVQGRYDGFVTNIVLADCALVG